jgi:hypothetical protein
MAIQETLWAVALDIFSFRFVRSTDETKFVEQTGCIALRCDLHQWPNFRSMVPFFESTPTTRFDIGKVISSSMIGSDNNCSP